MSAQEIRKVETLPVNLTVEEAMEVLKISRPTIYEEINSGRLRSLRIKSRRFIRGAEIDRYLEAGERAG